MKSLKRDEIEQNLLKIFDIIDQGEEVIIKGKDNNEKIAVIVPFKKFKQNKKRPLGILKGKASFKIKDDFKMDDREFLSL